MIIKVYYKTLLDSNSQVNGSTPGGDVFGVAVDENGKTITQHTSSSLSFLMQDIDYKTEMELKTKAYDLVFVEGERGAQRATGPSKLSY